MNAAENMLLNLVATLQSTPSAPARKPSGSEKADGPGFKDLLQRKSDDTNQSDTPAEGLTTTETTPGTLQQELAAALALQSFVPVLLVAEEVQPPAAVLPIQTEPVVQMAVQEPSSAPTPAPQVEDTAVPMQQAEAPPEVQGEQPLAKPIAEQPAVVETQEALVPKEQSADGQLAPTKARDGDEQKVLAAQDLVDRPLFRAGDEAPIKVGDAPTLEADAPDFDAQLTQKVDAALEKGERRVEIRLNPKELGSVVVELTQKSDGALHVVLHATTEKAAGLLTEHVDGLGSLLRGNAEIPVRVEVQRHQESQQYQQQQDGGSRERHGQQQDQRQQQHRQSDDFLQQLRLGLVSTAS